MTPINWPAGLSTRITAWSEQTQPTVIRTALENGTVKVRKRFTGGSIIHVQCSTELRIADAELLMQFFNVDCLGGVNPFWFTNPLTQDVVDYRMMEAPVVTNLVSLAATINMRWEHLPYWGP